ncbi:unnamed protein product [Rotaria sordida]|uniref:Uncharacterized protein n=1 Tax=Rotaria sordida TaxID=392033 RepID=A0A814DJR1_9BILA|nr:unnamed protein product [Rotaria sordida]
MLCLLELKKKIIEKVNEYITRQGRLDVFVNVADILRTGSTVDIPVKEFRSILDTNMIGTFLICCACLPHSVITKGNIINTTSAAALHGHPFMSIHAASKGAIVAFTKSLA